MIIFYDFKIQAHLVHTAVSLDKIEFKYSHTSTIEELENILTSFDQIKICSICVSPNAVTNVESSVAIRDSRGTLRQWKYPTVISNNKITCKLYTKSRVSYVQTQRRFWRIRLCVWKYGLQSIKNFVKKKVQWVFEIFTNISRTNSFPLGWETNGRAL